MTSLPGVQLNYRNASAGGWSIDTIIYILEYSIYGWTVVGSEARVQMVLPWIASPCVCIFTMNSTSYNDTLLKRNCTPVLIQWA